MLHGPLSMATVMAMAIAIFWRFIFLRANSRESSSQSKEPGTDGKLHSKNGKGAVNEQKKKSRHDREEKAG